MKEVILRTPAKRYWGKSKSGKAEVFLTSGYGGEFYAIPLWSVISKRSYDRKINDDHSEPYIEIRFKSTAMEGGSSFASQLKSCIDRISSTNETEVLS